MVFLWSLNDSKSPQVSRTHLSILVILNSVVVWMVFTRPLISKFSSPFNNSLVTVPKVPITISITVTFMFHCFFNSLAMSWYISFFSLSFNFILWSAGTAKSTILRVLFSFFFFVDYYKVLFPSPPVLLVSVPRAPITISINITIIIIIIIQNASYQNQVVFLFAGF